MSTIPAPGGRRAIAARNVEAILDGAERLLRSGRSLTFSAVADEASVSRPTVYAHFADRGSLLAALIDRSASQALEAMKAADPDHGAAPEALARLVSSGWEHLARHLELAQAARGELSIEGLHSHHVPALNIIERLAERGQRDKAFRGDMPARWLATSCLALIHAAAQAVASGQMASQQAAQLLPITLADLCVGPKPRKSH